jgi:hypothetical protein
VVSPPPSDSSLSLEIMLMLHLVKLLQFIFANGHFLAVPANAVEVLNLIIAIKFVTNANQGNSNSILVMIHTYIPLTLYP